MTSIAAEWASAAKQRAAAAKVKPVRAPARTHSARRASYHGRNHVWIPSLGVSRSVVFFGCSSSGVSNYVYRWGCAGSNNVYLFGHAFSVFKPLHDAYVQHRLHKGMQVLYADGAGRVRSYRVSFWRVVSPTNGAWAYAAQSRPSMTLQTCVGSRSQYRLIVRLVRG
jgi:sortase (surface protein transpeptidase)